MDIQDIRKFQQDLQGKEYEDKLSKYFELHYELTNFVGVDFHIGEIYRKKSNDENDEFEYIAITHQYSDDVCYCNVLYDIDGNLLKPFVMGKNNINLILEKYERIGTYDELVNNKNKRVKMGLKLEERRLIKELEFIKKELNKDKYREEDI